ncbi:hypothetical protein ACFFX0_12620 [Citricoccus parietis]|uniref:Uncharacterized protein n=1 Tax=Citricoccus parietis TaxID=592307 RepID=A0ABV5G016_9MICC
MKAASTTPRNRRALGRDSVKDWMLARMSMAVPFGAEAGSGPRFGWSAVLRVVCFQPRRNGGSAAVPGCHLFTGESHRAAVTVVIGLPWNREPARTVREPTLGAIALDGARPARPRRAGHLVVHLHLDGLVLRVHGFHHGDHAAVLPLRGWRPVRVAGGRCRRAGRDRRADPVRLQLAGQERHGSRMAAPVGHRASAGTRGPRVGADPVAAGRGLPRGDLPVDRREHPGHPGPRRDPPGGHRRRDCPDRGALVGRATHHGGGRPQRGGRTAGAPARLLHHLRPGDLPLLRMVVEHRGRAGRSPPGRRSTGGGQGTAAIRLGSA